MSAIFDALKKLRSQPPEHLKPDEKNHRDRNVYSLTDIFLSPQVLLIFTIVVVFGGFGAILGVRWLKENMIETKRQQPMAQIEAIDDVQEGENSSSEPVLDAGGVKSVPPPPAEIPDDRSAHEARVSAPSATSPEAHLRYLPPRPQFQRTVPPDSSGSKAGPESMTREGNSQYLSPTQKNGTKSSTIESASVGADAPARVETKLAASGSPVSPDVTTGLTLDPEIAGAESQETLTLPTLPGLEAQAQDSFAGQQVRSDVEGLLTGGAPSFHQAVSPTSPPDAPDTLGRALQKGHPPVTKTKTAQVAELVTKLQRCVMAAPQSDDEAEMVTGLFNELERLKGKSNKFVLKLKAFWMITQKNHGLAVELLQEVLSMDPADKEAGVNMAIVEIKTGQLVAAQKRLEKLKVLYPESHYISNLSQQVASHGFNR